MTNRHSAPVFTAQRDCQPLAETSLSTKDSNSSLRYCITGELYSTGKQVTVSKWALLFTISFGEKKAQ